MKKLVKVKDLPIDGRCPKMSIMHSTYIRGLEMLRQKAKREHKKLLTDEGIEDYTK